jgi:hypothetical protein
VSGPQVFPNPYVSKSDVVARVVVVMRGVSDRRGLLLTGHRSRAVPNRQIHELMLTDEPSGPEATVQRVALLAFIEIFQGGVLLTGDRVEVAGQVIGTLAGFDDTHMPNHQNICLHTADLVDGERRGLRLGDIVRFYRDA